MSDAELVRMLLGAITVLASVIVFLFFRLEALTRRFYESALADAEVDRLLAEALNGLVRNLTGGHNG